MANTNFVLSYKTDRGKKNNIKKRKQKKKKKKKKNIMIFSIIVSVRDILYDTVI